MQGYVKSALGCGRLLPFGAFRVVAAMVVVAVDAAAAADVGAVRLAAGASTTATSWT